MPKSTFGGIAGPVIFSLVTLVAAELRPDYSHLNNFISELGANGSAYAALMNYAGFVLGGLLIATLGWSLIGRLSPGRLAFISSVLVILFGLGVAASGVISCDVGCPQSIGSTENAIHNSIAPIAFLCLIAASILLGIQWRSDMQLRSIALYSIATGVMGLVFLATLASSLESRELTGLWQRLLLLVLFTWCVVVSLKLRQYESPKGLTENDA